MPTLESIDAAMSNADRSIAVLPRLGGGQIAAAGRQPFRLVGTDAAVYQLRQANGRTLALRVPFTDTLNPTNADAWRRISTDPALVSLRTGKNAILVPDAQFVPDALSVPGPDSRLKRYPLMAMSWVMAPTLLTTVIRAAAASDGAYIGQLATAWAATAERLVAASFAHGDLTGDNVLVRPGIELALIDYDSAEWQSHAAGPQTRAASAYTHPQANASVGSSARDPFAALLIYASLRVLAEHPELRADHGDAASVPNGALLFSIGDLANPAASELFGQVRRITRDPATRQLVEQLMAACSATPGDVPTLPEILHPRPRPASTAAAPRPAPPARPVRDRSDAPASRDEARNSWAGAAASRPTVPTRSATPELVRSQRPPTPPSPAAGPPPAEAEASSRRRAPEPAAPTPQLAGPDRRGERPRTGPSQELVRSADREQLKRLLERGDSAAILSHWREHRLADDEKVVAQYGDRIRTLERDAAIGEAQRAAQNNDTVRFLRLWQRHDLATFPPARRLQPIAEVAHRRAEAADRLRSALSTRDVVTVARYWPSLKGDSLVGDLGIQAAEALQVHFGERIGSALARGDDDALIEAVRIGETQGVIVPLKTRRAVRAAQNRSDTRQQLDDAIRLHDHEGLADLLISGRLADIGDVPADINRRAHQALAWPHLTAAIEADRDDAILGAYDGALFEPRDGAADVLSTRERSRVNLASWRQGWLHDVREALKARDTRALGRAFASVPDGALDRLSAVERRRIERLASREEAATSLASAIASGDDVAIVSALTQVASIGGSLPDELDWAAVRGVVDRITLAEAIREAMAQDPPDAARLARLLPVARAAAAADPDRSEVDFAELEREVLRAAHINRLRTAIVSDDDDEIATAATPDPFNAIDRLPPEQKERVERALAERARATGNAPRDRFIPTIYGSETASPSPR
jgi:tRNA A-37 threonylcarbamoyl transferase component Bud32